MSIPEEKTADVIAERTGQVEVARDLFKSAIDNMSTWGVDDEERWRDAVGEWLQDVIESIGDVEEEVLDGAVLSQG